MTTQIIQALASAYLIWIGVIMKADGFGSSFIFKVVPVVFGMFLAFNTYAWVMGWPA